MKGYTEMEIKVEDVVVGDRLLNIRMDKPVPNSTAVLRVSATPYNVILRPWGDSGRWFGRGRLVKVLRKDP